MSFDARTPPPPGGAPAKKKVSTGTWVILVLALGVFGLCCVGMLSAIAIPAFINYVKRSKTAEAGMHLRELRDASEAHCRATGGWPGPAGPVPSIPPSDVKRLGDFDRDPEFVGLGFAPSEPLYYSYSIVPDGDGVALVAEGDLDADGIRSQFVVYCVAGCQCERSVEEVSPLE